MPWSTWIDIEPENTENETVRDLYRRTKNRITGQIPDTMRLTSLTPEVAGSLYDLGKAIEAAASGLSLREREITALIVSVNNGCVH